MGAWTIGFAPPRASLFSSYRVCDVAGDAFCKTTFKDAAVEAYKVIPRDVLSFNLSPNLPVGRWVEQAEWWKTTRERFSLDRDYDLAVANDLCNRAASELSYAGLNGVDSDLVLWAMLEGSPRPVRMEKTVKYQEASACKSVYDRVAGIKAPGER